ncbi:MAG TPA: ribonuclease J [Candidatus Stercoripulliclostridium merdipullorum]|uniref:Ribonuclease J n=1 Tax=Candidatus Stercoripulliclostridium merdipullorum TaxID=2840952 RepID=A0A9D1NAT4_9FIRM|nr:ribonuclease J [Candidatus Stercoripulliclostridium merdipullorum]
MSKKSKLKLIFLGGVGEIGKNMYALEYGDHILVVDSGMSFPDSELMPGIDYVIPDYNYLVANKSKIRGIVLTHGHEDHIGALPFLLKEIEAPLYGSNLTLALVEHKLKEHKIRGVKTYVAKDREAFTIGCFRVEFVRVTHSIAGAFALSIETPQGVVFFTGDFKIDHTPVDGKTIDLARIAEIGTRGVLLMLQDSTNVERDGFSMSERRVGQSLENIFSQNMHKRLIIATFASNIHRVQQIINCALKYNRKIAFSGRSMINIAEIAAKIKELNYPADSVVDIEKIGGIPYDRLCIISTGTQGEQDSALARMAQDDFKRVTISSTDTVVLSSSPIPGNEKGIYKVINNLCRKGADVIYQSLTDVHVSGHACREELKMMMALVKPKYFIPIHGEYRHLKQHAELGMRMGIPKANILIPELGNVIEVSKAGLKKLEPVRAGSVMLDGSAASDNVDMVVRDRLQLAEDGFVVAIVIVSATGEPTVTPNIIMRGISVPDNVYDDMKDTIVNRLRDGSYRELDGAELNRTVRKLLAKILFNRLKKRPMIVPVIVEN